MMFVESLIDEDNLDYITLEVKIESGLFAQYLLSRNQRYPSYIQSNTLWYSLLNPYKPYIAAFPEEKSHIVKVNEPMMLKLPPNSIPIYRNVYKKAMIQCLLAWVEEEYKQYQVDWHNKNKPLATSFDLDMDVIV